MKLGLSRESRYRWWYIGNDCEVFRWRAHKDSASLFSYHFRLVCANSHVLSIYQINLNVVHVQGYISARMPFQ